MSDVQTAAIDHEVQALSRITDRPNLVALAYSLRHPETWPADFVWDYRNCTKCAIGLSLRLWPKLQLPQPSAAAGDCRTAGRSLRALQHPETA